MQIHQLTQGSDEWLLFRSQHSGASEAAAMLGISTKVKRNELLHMKYTGSPKEFSDWVQTNILDHGHVVEGPGRELMEAVIDDEFYPVTCSDGPLSASCDGLTLDRKKAFEHKQWNAALAEAVEQGFLPDEYMPQCQQVLMVTGADILYFAVSDGTPDQFVYLEVLPDQEWFSRIRAGWEQFAKDLETYQPTAYSERPVADAIKHLPALAIQIRGEVVNSNLPMYAAAAERYIDGIKTELVSDEDFVAAEANVKFCKNAEDSLEAAKTSAIKQTSSIDELIRTVDFIKDKLRQKRLTLEKLVVSQKTALKESILLKAKAAFNQHIADIEKEIAPIRLICAAPDFAAAMKAKRTLASLDDAADTALANGKIAADGIARDIRTKLGWIKEQHADYGFLFKDLQQIIYKPEEDFQMVVNTRVDTHKAEEDRKAKEIADKAVAAEQARVAAETAAAAAKAALPISAQVQETIKLEQPRAAATETVSPIRPMPAVNRAPIIDADIDEGPTDIDIIELIASTYGLTPKETIARIGRILLSKAREHFDCQAA